MSAAIDILSAEHAGKLAGAITSIPGITGLHEGDFGEVALLYPHRRVKGLRLVGMPAHTLEVHAIADLPALLSPTAPGNFSELADQVRAVVEKHLSIVVDVIFADGETAHA